MLKAENQSYWLDRETGRLRIPVRGTEGVQLHLPLSAWHRVFLSDSSWTLASLTVVPGKIILVVRREAPKAYDPERVIALDTNEDSLDGVCLHGGHGPYDLSVRRRSADPADPLPTAQETRDEKGIRPEGHASPIESGRTQGEKSRSSEAASTVQATHSFGQRWSGGDRSRGTHSPRSRRPLPPDEPPSLLLAPRRDPSSDRIQGRPRGRARHQGQPCMDQ